MNYQNEESLYTQTTISHYSWQKINEYVVPVVNTENGAILNSLGEEISKEEAVFVGIDKYYPQNKSGFGTNFHEVYQNSPDIYAIFSEAEDREDILLSKIMELHRKYAFKSIVDVACGTGKFLKKITKEIAFEKVFGLDINKPLLEFARANLPNSIEFLCSPAEKIPLLDNSVDFCMTTWGSFSPSETFSEMERIVKHKGIILRIGTAKHDDLTSLFPEYDAQTVLLNMKFLEAHGFTSEILPIKISFPSIERAREILSKVTGCDPNRITSSTLTHYVFWSWKQVEKQ